MEARTTRRSLATLPPDLGFTQDPKDPLRQILDIPGRQVQFASEYLDSQLNNTFIETADPNEPAIVYTSGHLVPEDATVSGNLVDEIQGVATMRVTGFDYIRLMEPSGLSGGELYGISYSQEPFASGNLYLSTSGVPYIFQYDMSTLSTLTTSGTFGINTIDFETQEKDEYLVIKKGTVYGTIATLKNTPRGPVVVYDSKNLQAPWDPANSDGLTADSNEIEVSGSTLILTSPRPSWVPSSMSGQIIVYPPNYQPDQYWESSFIAEYEYTTKEAAYGLSQEELRHYLGLEGLPIGGANASD